jgi:hypothetical protein
MKKKIKIVFLILGISIITDCGSLPSESMKTFMDSSKKEGMIVGTISLENRKTISATNVFFYKKDGLPRILSVKIVDSLKAIGNYKDNYDGIVIDKEKGDFIEDNKWIYLFNIVKPSGKYSFYERYILLNTGSMQSRREIPMQIPFEIEEGKIKYIGEIKLNVKKGEIEILNKIERDRKIFKEKFPNIEF